MRKGSEQGVNHAGKLDHVYELGSKLVKMRVVMGFQKLMFRSKMITHSPKTITSTDMNNDNSTLTKS